MLMKPSRCASTTFEIGSPASVLDVSVSLTCEAPCSSCSVDLLGFLAPVWVLPCKLLRYLPFLHNDRVATCTHQEWLSDRTYVIEVLLVRVGVRIEPVRCNEVRYCGSSSTYATARDVRCDWVSDLYSDRVTLSRVCPEITTRVDKRFQDFM